MREIGDIYLERELFAELVSLCGLPETIVNWTQSPHEEGEGADGNAQPMVAQ